MGRGDPAMPSTPTVRIAEIAAALREGSVEILPDQRLPIVIPMRLVDFRRGNDGLAATTLQKEMVLDPHFGQTQWCSDQSGAAGSGRQAPEILVCSLDPGPAESDQSDSYGIL